MEAYHAPLDTTAVPQKAAARTPAPTAIWPTAASAAPTTTAPGAGTAARSALIAHRCRTRPCITPTLGRGAACCAQTHRWFVCGPSGVRRRTRADQLSPAGGEPPAPQAQPGPLTRVTLAGGRPPRPTPPPLPPAAPPQRPTQPARPPERPAHPQPGVRIGQPGGEPGRVAGGI